MSKIKLLLVSALTVIGIGVAVPASVGAADLYNDVCKTQPDNSLCSGQTSLAEQKAGALIKTIIDTLLFLLGAICVIVIIVGGFRYVTSNGNSESVKSAKNIILYAVIGLVVALAAYAIVGFVIDAL